MSIKNKLDALKNRTSKIILANSNIFTKYFLLFAAIFIIVFTVLGSSLFILVNNYTADERTQLLKSNTAVHFLSDSLCPCFYSSDKDLKETIAMSLRHH